LGDDEQLKTDGRNDIQLCYPWEDYTKAISMEMLMAISMGISKGNLRRNLLYWEWDRHMKRQFCEKQTISWESKGNLTQHLLFGSLIFPAMNLIKPPFRSI